MVSPIKDRWQSDDGQVTLLLGDCLQILSTMKGIDAVVTDPPYGINHQPQSWKTWRGSPMGWNPIQGDDKPFDPSPLLRFSEVIVWGATHYSDKLPAGDWLIWDKRCSERVDGMIGDPAELAWKSNGCGKVHIKRLLHGGVVNADSRRGNNAARVHPTQKPIELMTWCLSFSQGTVADPYMGSGTTGVACIRTGRRFIGIEIERKYWEIAVDRCKREIKLDKSSFQIRPKPRPAPVGFFEKTK